MPAIKACLIGEAAVGKTTICNMLQNKNVNGPRKPTIGVEVNVTNIDEDTKVALWDLAGQRRFHMMWDEFMRGSNITLVVTDSTPKNVMLTKDLIERHLTKSAAKIIAIANKQDLEGRMSASDIQAALGVPTFSMVATNKDNEEALRNIILRTLNEP
jgi:small GTP-binding protein